MNYSPENKRPQIIGLIGETGVGKTKNVDVLKALLNIKGYYENPGQNPYLGDSYEQPTERIILNSQLWFADKKRDFLDEINAGSDQGEIVSLDMAPQGDKALALNKVRLGLMNPLDYEQIYLPLYNKLFPNHSVAVLIYIQAEIETILKRIARRIEEEGRDYEKGITAEYLLGLRQVNEFIVDEAERDGIKVYRFNTENLNFRDNPDHRAEYANFVKTEILPGLLEMKKTTGK